MIISLMHRVVSINFSCTVCSDIILLIIHLGNRPCQLWIRHESFKSYIILCSQNLKKKLLITSKPVPDPVCWVYFVHLAPVSVSSIIVILYCCICILFHLVFFSVLACKWFFCCCQALKYVNLVKFLVFILNFIIWVFPLFYKVISYDFCKPWFMDLRNQ
jgi:hypothetical protein